MVNLNIKENYSLKEHTTMHVGGSARYFVQVCNADELKEAILFSKKKNISILMLGGGSNIIISDNGFDGLVIQLNNKGREILEDTNVFVRIKLQAGEVLSETINWVVENGWCGIENLSFIPGNIAGLAVQNVNAYGHDASRVIESVDAIDINSCKEQTIENKNCAFGYRRSRFNKEDKGKFIITAVTLRLHKKCEPMLTYPDVKKWFEGRNHFEITTKEISQAITTIRKNKGQDPSEIWSAGSSFKNLLLTEQEFQILLKTIKKNYGDDWEKQILELKNKFAQVETIYTSQTGVKELDRGAKIKIPIAFIMDKIMNLKGLSVGGAQISQKQVINIINTGNATADDVMSLFKKIRQLIYNKTGMIVQNEPELVGFNEDELKFHFSL